MKKNCENLNCTEPSYKKVLIRDKKNKEYKYLCYDHYILYTKKNTELSCEWDGCNDVGEFKAPSKNISVKFIANSMAIMLIRLIPVAIFNASLKGIVLSNKIVSRIMLVKIPLIIAIGIISIIEVMLV